MNHPDGRLRRAKTLWKYAWCVALLGHDPETIVMALVERDSRPEYQKYTGNPDGGTRRYWQIASQVLWSHETWAKRQRRQASS